MGIFLSHFTINRVAFKDNGPAADGFRIELVVDENIWLIVDVYVTLGDSDRIIKVDWKFSDNTRIVVIRNLLLLS